jgi:hypothetical protein
LDYQKAEKQLSLREKGQTQFFCEATWPEAKLAVV